MAQRKKTEPIEYEGLPDLTESQYQFVLGLLAGKAATDAYREAYEAIGWTPNALAVEASRLKSNPKISLWLNRLKAQQAHEGAYTLQDHVEELDRLRDIAEQSGNIGAAVQAAQLKGKALGMYVDRYKDETPRESAEDIMARGIEMFGDAFKSTPLYERLQARVTRH